jgi:hypothetical protein
MMKFLDMFNFSHIFNGAKRSETVEKPSALEFRQKIENQLYYDAKPARKTVMPNPAPQFADKLLLDFYDRTECLQPYFNAILGGNYSFDEEQGHHVTLGTYDSPDTGRTFQIRYNAAIVGKLAVVPKLFPKGNAWAELRLRLNFPIDLVESERVHGFLSALASSVFDSVNEPTQSGQAEQVASTAMVKALWNARADEESNFVVEMSLSGSWGGYQSYVDHWHNNGVDPWRDLEPKRDNPQRW